MALQDLCLTAIVEDFERYYTAFSTSQDANLKRMSEFLQRVYSFEIAQQIYEESEMEDKYAEFLVNKYLKILDTNWFGNFEWKSIVAKIADIGSNIKKIHFHEHNEERPWEEIFCYLPNVEVVIFHRDCVDEILVHIAKFCPNILEIDIRSSYDITEEGLRSLCKKKNGKVCCPNLKRLYLKACGVTEAIAICLIRNLPSLELFDYSDLALVLYTMHKEDLSNLDKIPPYKLTKLDLFSASPLTYFANVFQVCLSVCPFLTTLTCPIKQPEHLDFLLELSHLEVLSLEYDQKNLLCINNFLKSKRSKLTSLSIRKCSLSVLTLAESCPALKQLCMQISNFEPHDGNSIPLFHNLQDFSVSELNNTNSNYIKPMCLVLSSSPKLESITFERCNLAELKAGILKCCEQCSLKKVDFSFSSADKPFVMDILLTCHSLETLNLEGCGITSFDENEILRCAEILPNTPEVYFTEQLSVSDYDDFFEDYYDHDFEDGEDYDDYEDYLHVYDDDDEDEDDYNADYYI